MICQKHLKKFSKNTNNQEIRMKTANDPNFFWRTDKISLRPLKLEDSQKKWGEWFDTETRRYLEYQLDLPPVSLAEYTRQLEDICEFNDTSRFTSFAIDNLDGEFVGWINLFSGSPRHGNFSFGISIFRDFRQQGCAADAVRLILRYGFNELRGHKCNSECLAVNQGSIRLHQKLGFQEEGRRRQSVYMDGAYRDLVLFGLLKEEFRFKSGV
jgi:RimJ/RimL family protein N-acetyltransferase